MNNYIKKLKIIKQLKHKLKNDFSFSKSNILGSMCSKPDDFSKYIFSKYIEKNIGDPGLFPSTQKLETKTIKILGNYLGLKDPKGYIVTGGTEANILAIWTAKNMASENQREVILPESAHYSFDKAASLMDLKLIKIPLNPDHSVNTTVLEKKICKNTMAIIGVAGSTGLGQVDDIKKLSEIASKNNIYLHIDAAFGGYILPFLKEAGYPTRIFDFTLPGVKSITIDPHKMGRSVIPSGCIIYRNESISQYTQTNVTYLSGGKTHQGTIVGTRSGASVASVWAMLKLLDKKGYTKIIKTAMELTYWFKSEIEKINNIEIVINPVMNVLGLKHKKLETSEFASIIRKNNWAVSEFDSYIRICLMPHLNKRKLRPFITFLQNI